MVSDYWALTKPEVNFLIAMATFIGFSLGRATEPHNFPFSLLIHTLLRTLQGRRCSW
jgi:heme O synthase-like polyprenyltransferase